VHEVKATFDPVYPHFEMIEAAVHPQDVSEHMRDMTFKARDTRGQVVETKRIVPTSVRIAMRCSRIRFSTFSVITARERIRAKRSIVRSVSLVRYESPGLMPAGLAAR
jgi:hypothetical protein